MIAPFAKVFVRARVAPLLGGATEARGVPRDLVSDFVVLPCVGMPSANIQAEMCVLYATPLAVVSPGQTLLGNWYGCVLFGILASVSSPVLVSMPCCQHIM